MKSIIAPLTLLFISFCAHAETPVEKGLRLAKEAKELDSGWKDRTANMVMILRNRYGDESRREIRSSALEIIGDGDKSLTIFDAPGDVKGTAFLSYSHALDPDDQWLYLPFLKRVKRIASRNKSGPFMGSEFSYEDLSSQEVEKFTYKWLRDETVQGSDAHVIERTPVYEYSGYARQIVWLDTKILQPIKVVYYDRKNTLLKTLSQQKYLPYLSKPYWRPSKSIMTNHQTGKVTTLLWSNYKLNTGLTNRNFDKNHLARVR